MYQEQAEAFLANQPPEALATGELFVIKNTIKRYVSGPNRARLMRLANSVLGNLCTRANAGNIDRIRALFQSMVQMIKSGNIGLFENEITRSKTEF
ncbi:MULTISPECIES: hypothetical protein [Aliivibrio]|jgi:hypothetical protein|uniref:Uncharacterized protein n=2 Tax=Aliivibrio logei TaxID=688 RepID=A0A1B9NZB9_ALILO|nr:MULTISPECIES: hypothetical protein [Aliivibrio]MBB1312068.1 hypothetical protein [Aliivibrio sp. SR45-2]OCH21359.1 hypothetical protein A6E04_12520 [Aliivibrio logei]OEF23050.1 hypothetical protein A1Q5_00035 [Aliivibrio logei 5S-186]